MPLRDDLADEVPNDLGRNPTRSEPRGDLFRAERSWLHGFERVDVLLKARIERRRDEADYARGRLTPIRSMANARAEPEKFTAPQIYKIPKPVYTEQARRNRIEGIVRIQALFGCDGQIAQAIVTQGLGFGLDGEATRAARRIEFTPGHLDSRPVSVWAGVAYQFSVPDVKPIIPTTPKSKTY